MLTAIHEKTTGWVAWLIVILITVVFALWGIQSYFVGGTERTIATVNGKDISLSLYRSELSRQRQAITQRMGSNPSSLDDLGLAEAVLDGLIKNQLVSQYVNEQNYRFSDDQLKQNILAIPQFQESGKFSEDKYRLLLSQLNFTVKSFEDERRHFGVIEQLRHTVVSSAFALDGEINRLLILWKQQRKADYAQVKGSDFVDSIDISEMEIDQAYQFDPNKYWVEPRIKVEYIDLSMDKLAQSIKPTETEIKQMYEQGKRRYKTRPGVRRVSHILFAVKKDAGKKEIATVEKKARGIYAKINTGADFGEMANQFSDDPASKDKQGDVGFINRGQMVKAFEDAVFAMQEGEVRGPIRSGLGFHLIKLTQLTVEKYKPLQDVRQEIIKEIINRKAETDYADLGETFQDLVFEFPESLALIAEKMGLTIEQSDWFTADEGQGIASEAEIRATAFSNEVVEEGLNSTVELGFDRMVALRKVGYQSGHIQSLDQVRPQISEEIRRHKVKEQVKAKGQAILDALKQGAGWQKVLTDNKLESIQMPSTREQSSGQHSEVVQAVFAAKQPTSEQPVFGGIEMLNGDYVVYNFSKFIPGDPNSINETERNQMRQLITQGNGQYSYAQLLEQLRRQADITIFTELLDDSDNIDNL